MAPNKNLPIPEIFGRSRKKIYSSRKFLEVSGKFWMSPKIFGPLPKFLDVPGDFLSLADSMLSGRGRRQAPLRVPLRVPPGRPYQCVIGRYSHLNNDVVSIEMNALQPLRVSSRGDPPGLRSSGSLRPCPERIDTLAILKRV
jgi:hypothetical protein